jgi:hypothetical protein
MHLFYVGMQKLKLCLLLQGLSEVSFVFEGETGGRVLPDGFDELAV